MCVISACAQCVYVQERKGIGVKYFVGVLQSGRVGICTLAACIAP